MRTIGLRAEAPFRDELFSVDQLHGHAKTLGKGHGIGKKGRLGAKDRLLPRLAENKKLLREGYRILNEAAEKGQKDHHAAAEWFIDNYSLIEEQILTARRHFPAGYSRDLPQLSEGALAGYPRVYAIALELISHVDGRLDAESLRVFVAAYQLAAPLRLGELWAIPIMLRLALLENLRRVVARVVAGRRDRERAGYWIERMLEVAAKAPAEVVVVLAEMVKENPPLTTAFVSEFATRLQGQGSALNFPMTWLGHRIAEQGQTIETVFHQASQSQAADQVSIGNSIGSLRFLGAMDWREFVEAMSGMERVLRGDPAQVYSAMDFGTRDRYRHVVEEIAKRSELTEEEVATTAVGLAREILRRESHVNGNGTGDKGRRSHVGYFLVGKGQRELERAARKKVMLGEILRRELWRVPLAMHVGSISVLTAVIAGLLAWRAEVHGLEGWRLAAWSVAMFVGVSQLAVALIHWLSLLLVGPRVLPRMDFSKGIPAAHQTVVVVPTMLTDVDEVKRIVEALEVRFLANRDGNLSFALLTDFADAASEKMPGDEELLESANGGD